MDPQSPQELLRVAILDDRDAGPTPPPPDRTWRPDSPIPATDTRYADLSDPLPVTYWPVADDTRPHESDDCDCGGIRFGWDCICS